MTEANTTEQLPQANGGEKTPDQRAPRTIRFSDAEWEKVEQAAREIGISPATFARNAALRAAAVPRVDPTGLLPPELLELVKRIYRSTYILSTLKRDELIREGRRQELDRTVQAAREAQAFLLGDATG